MAEAGEGFVKIAVADVEAELEEGTDAAFLAAGYASVTPLAPICEDDVELAWAAASQLVP